jgi:hypothetical protein
MFRYSCHIIFTYQLITFVPIFYYLYSHTALVPFTHYRLSINLLPFLLTPSIQGLSVLVYSRLRS